MAPPDSTCEGSVMTAPQTPCEVSPLRLREGKGLCRCHTAAKRRAGVSPWAVLLHDLCTPCPTHTLGLS